MTDRCGMGHMCLIVIGHRKVPRGSCKDARACTSRMVCRRALPAYALLDEFGKTPLAISDLDPQPINEPPEKNGLVTQRHKLNGAFLAFFCYRFQGHQSP